MKIATHNETFHADEVTASIIFSLLYDDIEFIGWNTKYDGSGKWYYPEDSIVMDDSDVYLFAQWQGQTGVEYKPAPQKNLTILQRIAEYIKSVF